MGVHYILPVALVIPVAVKRQIMNPGFESICFVGPDVSSSFSFCPLSVIVSVATLLHLGTIGFMIKIAVEANSSSSVSNLHSRSYGNNSTGNNNHNHDPPVNATSKPPATSPNSSNNNGALPVVQMKAFQ